MIASGLRRTQHGWRHAWMCGKGCPVTRWSLASGRTGCIADPLTCPQNSAPRVERLDAARHSENLIPCLSATCPQSTRAARPHPFPKAGRLPGERLNLTLAILSCHTGPPLPRFPRTFDDFPRRQEHPKRRSDTPGGGTGNQERPRPAAPSTAYRRAPCSRASRNSAISRIA
jgi:hypothetical protein